MDVMYESSLGLFKMQINTIRKIDGRSKPYKAALKFGISQDEYLSKLNTGLKLCTVCGNWKDSKDFYYDNTQNNVRHPSCKECVKEKAKKLYRRKTPRRLFAQYKGNAKYRGHKFELTLDDFENLDNQECVYCGDKDNLGFDRIDNDIGYIRDNIVVCCWTCNHMKYQFSVNDWLDHMNKILKNYKKLI